MFRRFGGRFIRSIENFQRSYRAQLLLTGARSLLALPSAKRLLSKRLPGVWFAMREEIARFAESVR